jgi:putative flippase GtrA
LRNCQIKNNGVIMQDNTSISGIKRVTRFGITGASAMTVHFTAAIVLVSYFNITPLIANIIAFMTAFSVSFYGHRRWTFSDINNTDMKKTLFKFFITAAISFTLNEAMFAYLLSRHQLAYYFCLAIVLIVVSGVTFIISRYWAFK